MRPLEDIPLDSAQISATPPVAVAAPVAPPPAPVVPKPVLTPPPAPPAPPAPPKPVPIVAPAPKPATVVLPPVITPKVVVEMPRPTPPPPPAKASVPPPPMPPRPQTEIHAPEKNSAGAIIGVFIILVLLAVGAFYFWGAHLNAQQTRTNDLPFIPGDPNFSEDILVGTTSTSTAP